MDRLLILFVLIHLSYGTVTFVHNWETAIHTHRMVKRQADYDDNSNNCDVSFVFNTSDQAAYFSSPGYPYNYPPLQYISYCISSPPDTVMTLNCTDFHVEYQRKCKYDRLSFSLSGDYSYSDATYACGDGTFSVTTTTNQFPITFQSDFTNPFSRNGHRFRCLLYVSDSNSISTTTPPAPAPVGPSSSPQNATTGNGSCSCGQRNNVARIVGGVTAKVNEFPWRCYLRTDQYVFFCGCSIISNSWIMTAAHCTNAVMPITPSNPLYVVVGASDLSKSSEPTRVVMTVDRVIQNTAYNNKTQDFDMSLLHLSTPLTFNIGVSPVCLPWKFANQNFMNASVVASGWGTTMEGGNISVKLKDVNLPVLTTQQCRKYFGSAITDNMFCTYSPGKDTCQGDSGGSIDYYDSTTDSYFGIGVVSWGIGCAEKNDPGVYTKVTNFLSWIKSNTGETFCNI